MSIFDIHPPELITPEVLRRDPYFTWHYQVIPAEQKADYWYLAGPMTGIPQFNFPAFDAAAERLRALGYSIVSPAELDDDKAREIARKSKDGRDVKSTGHDYTDYLRRDLNIVMDKVCIGVICLPGWTTSNGARMETYVAAKFGKPLFLWQEPSTLVAFERDDVIVPEGWR